MGKSTRQRLDEMRAQTERWEQEDERRAVADGKTFCTVKDRYRVYFSTQAEAQAELDKFVREHDRPIPLEYYDSEGRVDTWDTWIERHDGDAWIMIDGTKKAVVWNITIYGAKD